MNKQQKGVEFAKLSDEKKVLAALKRQYEQASKDVANKISLHNGRINSLLKDWDDLDDAQKSILQSQIYQRDYQQALQKQIEGYLDDLNSKQHETVSDYLKECYDTGYLGTMYDLHGQGIPLIMPIDQKQVLEAVMLDSKVSKKLYGSYVNQLKKRIQQEISRGIATASSYADIARNLDKVSNIGYNKAARIARTEGHGVQCQAASDAQYAAKDAGADIVKQWDAALDSRTRDSHKVVDGQIRELDEKFSNGMKRPGDPSGGAAEVVNCRCALLQRARWALGEDELKNLQERAAYYGLDKTKDFDDFKKRYLKAAESSKIEVPKEQSESYKALRDKLKTDKVTYNEVQLLKEQLRDVEIIERLAGGDMTKGSCSSLGFAYIGNKHGFDVLDFRGGNSQEFFSRNSNIKKILGLPDVKGSITMVQKEAAETAKIIEGLEYGKEYYVAVGRHAAIVRNTKNGAEYLELQSSKENGWIPFNKYGSTAATLQKRFGCRKTAHKKTIGGKTITYEKSVVMMEVDSFAGNGEFKDILGYINTAASKQKKGASGNVK